MQNKHIQKNTLSVRFFYGSSLGRTLLKFLMTSHVNRLVACYLCSSASRPFIRWYAKINGIALERGAHYNSFCDFFIRPKKNVNIDFTPGHLISPCDGYLSTFPIEEDSSFYVKGKRYRLCDLLQDNTLARRFYGGDCLIIRLTPTDFHHYCYIDDGMQGQNHFIDGELHSVQSAACEQFSVYTLNRRCWTLLETKHFGYVVQTEVGALAVGGIVNERESATFQKGEEMGHFELAGSTILLFFQRGKVDLAEHIQQHLTKFEEFRVTQGMCIGVMGKKQ